MFKRVFLMACAILLLPGLPACVRNENIQREGTENNQNGSLMRAGYKADHDGPMTELFDYSAGHPDHFDDNDRLLPPGSPAEYTKYSGGSLTESKDNKEENTAYIRDINYHAHLNDNDSAAKYNAYDGRLANDMIRAAGSVPNIYDARAVVYGENVLLSLVLKDRGKAVKTKQEVRNVVQPYMQERKLTILTDIGTYYRVKTLDNDLRNGGPRDRIQLDVNDILITSESSKNQ